MLRTCALFTGIVASALTPWACGSEARAQPVPTALVVPGDLAAQGRALAATEEGLRVVVARDAGPLGPELGDAIAQARAAYVALDFERSFETIRGAVVRLEARARTRADFDALAEALVLRGMGEQALGHTTEASASFAAAARLRPDRTLAEERYPPPVREAYEAERGRVRAEPAGSITVTARPAGARLFLDGEERGAAPATLHGTSGRHQLRVEAAGHAERALTVTLSSQGADPLEVELPPAGEDEAARDALALEAVDPGEATRRALGQSLRARRLLRARPTAAGVEALSLDLETGHAGSATGPTLEAALATLRAGTQGGDAPAPTGGARRNEGFFARLAAGVNLRSTTFEQDDPSRRASASSLAADVEIALGYTLGGGFVLGGALLALFGDSTLDVETPGTGQARVGSVGGLAIFGLWYPGAEGGLHFSLAIGGARGALSSRDVSVQARDSLVGASLAIGAGYDFWVADAWAVGGLLRLIGFSMEQDGTRATAGGLSLVATVTTN